jgi:hypothetical protein
MRHRVVIIRLVALLVLVTSACDYCAFDLSDQTAPISLTRSKAIGDLVPDRQSSVQNLTTELPDDQCLGCAPSILPRPLTVHRVTPDAFVFQASEAPVPLSNRFIPKRPPRA